MISSIGFGLLSTVPRERRIVIDCDGHYNEPIAYMGDYNHRTMQSSAEWIGVCDGIADKIFQPTYRPRHPNVRSFLFHIYDPDWETPLKFSDKEFSMIYVGHTKFRWRGMVKVLKAIERVRDRVGRVALVGEGWGEPIDWMEHGEAKAKHYVDRDYMKAHRFEGLPPVPFQEVAATINKGVFNPVVYRPLFEQLGFVTCRTFETPAAGTIPLFLLNRDYVLEFYGERATELMLDGEDGHERILDVLERPEYYAEIVMDIRRGFRDASQSRSTLEAADWPHRGVVLRAGCDPELLRPTRSGSASRLRYGFNEIDGWPAFAMGERRGEIHRRLRLMNTEVIRIFVFDKPVPDPFSAWPQFAAVIDGVLASGAKPMVTFAKFKPPFDDRTAIKRFVARSTEIIWGCLEQWGIDEVKTWSWCLWNEPNNPDVGGNLRYGEYLADLSGHRRAPADTHRTSYPGRQRSRLGGPAIDGTQRAYWLDWIAQLVSDVDERTLAFVNWHMYADWRPAVPWSSVKVKLVDEPDAPDGSIFEALTMAQTAQYEARARSVSRLIAGRGILNVCGELNAIAHHDRYFTQDLNRNVFGAAYYASTLLNLIRGGADLEMRWTATSKRWHGLDDAYGLMSTDGEPTPACLAKQLVAQHVRCGDRVATLPPDVAGLGIDGILARDDTGRLSGLFVNTLARSQRLDLSRCSADLAGCSDVLRLDGGTAGKVVRERLGGSVSIDGYGVAVVTDDGTTTEID